jgi:hypothetical protein
MKMIILICTLFIPSLGITQVTDKPYDFPVKPGSIQWAKLSSSKEMDSVCIIPDQILKDLSTKALLITCLNYPRIIDFFLSDNLQSGFNFYAKHFNGLAELLKRPDLSKVLLQVYSDINLKKERMIEYDNPLSYLQIAFFELLIAQETIINQYGNNEKLKVLSEAIMKLEQRQQQGESPYRQTTTALILSRILDSENKNLSEINQKGKDIFKIFNSTAFLVDVEIINKLLVASKNIKEF